MDVAQRAHLGDGRRAGALRVLATVKRDGIGEGRQVWSKEDEQAFKTPIREQYESQGHPYYASARLWDDGVIDPAGNAARPGTRPLGQPQRASGKTSFGVFRM